jgi:hypothetical protein
LPIIKIPVGSNFDQYRLEAGTYDLGATGVFEEVRCAYRLENGAVKVDFIFKENAQFHLAGSLNGATFSRHPTSLTFSTLIASCAYLAK